MEDNVLIPYPLAIVKHILGRLTENRERYLGKQETEPEGMNEIGMDKINLYIK
jgi:hypothetical protein